MATAFDEDLLQLCWDWLESHLAFFDPRSREEQYEMAHLKAFDELCLMASLKPSRQSRTYLNDSVVDFCLDVLGDRPIPDVFVRHLSEFQLLAIPAKLQMKFSGKSSLRELILETRNQLPILSAERLPHRLLDIIYCTESIGLETEVFITRQALDQTRIAAMQCSNLSLGVCPIKSTLADFYAFTHTIFFLTQFGSTNKSLGISRSKLIRLTHITELAMLRFLADGNQDIVAELLWSLIMLDAPKGAAFVVAGTIVAASIKINGYLAGPQLIESLPVSENDRMTYLNYHSTLLACGLLSQGMMHTVSAQLSIQGRAMRDLAITPFIELGASIREMANKHPLERIEMAQRVAQLAISIEPLRPEWGEIIARSS